MSSNSSISNRSKRIQKRVNPKLPVRKSKHVQKKSQFNKDSGNLIEESDAGSGTNSIQSIEVHNNNSMTMSDEERFIGPIPESERHRRVLKYLQKKYNKIFMKKFTYSCRKQVAEKRLRIKGRFVTKEQAFEILGLTQD